MESRFDGTHLDAEHIGDQASKTLNQLCFQPYFRPRLLATSKGAEASDVIALGIKSVYIDKVDDPATVNSLYDSLDIAGVQTQLRIRLLDGNFAVHAATDFIVSVTTGTTAISADDQPEILVASLTGEFNVEITDVVGGADETVIVEITPVNTLGAMVIEEVTFDAV